MSNPSSSLRPFDPASDLAAVASLWEECLGTLWPIDGAGLRRFATGHPWYRPGDHFVAEDRREVVGFVATQIHRGTLAPSTTGGVAVILVAPRSRREGIGSRLMSQAIEHLRHQGVRRAEIGGGGGTWRFWAGIPTSLAPATGFFERTGFASMDRTYDLIQDLRGYREPPELHSGLAAASLQISLASESDYEQLLQFELRNFPQWAEYYHDAFRVGDYRDILIVRSESVIAGALLLFDHGSRHIGGQVVWQMLLGEDMGGLAGVGVDVNRRGGGIGLLLVAAGSEILKRRGVGTSYIEWTSRLSFYERLGYTLWQDYTMLARELDP